MTQKIKPFLWFENRAEEAVTFYASIFTDAKITAINRTNNDETVFPGPVMTMNFELAGREFIALNGGPYYTFNPAISFVVGCESEAELDELWAKLSDGGQVLMPLDKYPFNDHYGWLNDRFGVSWQLILRGVKQTVHPNLMFADEQNGLAEEAIRFYTSIFDNSSIGTLNRYPAGQNEAENAINYGEFTLEGQPYSAIDAGSGHHFPLSAAVSFFINCETQEEIDRFWIALGEGGSPIQCGWLKDKYGVQWQVVPSILGTLLGDPDPEKSNRAMQAMLGMIKLDIAALQAAHDGTAG